MSTRYYHTMLLAASSIAPSAAIDTWLTLLGITHEQTDLCTLLATQYGPSCVKRTHLGLAVMFGNVRMVGIVLALGADPRLLSTCPEEDARLRTGLPTKIYQMLGLGGGACSTRTYLSE